MQIDLPNDIFARIQQRATSLQGISEVDVIRKALDSLDWMDKERQAIQTGISAWLSGDVQDFKSFDREFRAKNGIRSEA